MSLWNPLGEGSPIWLQRLSNVYNTAMLALQFTENGNPRWKVTMPVTCQPPKARSAGLLILLRNRFPSADRQLINHTCHKSVINIEIRAPIIQTRIEVVHVTGKTAAIRANARSR